MRVAHLLRKYNPSEWGGTETAVKCLLDGLSSHQVSSVVYAPRLDREWAGDPFRQAGHNVRRFHALVPVWGIGAEQRQQLISVGGNLLSFDLIWRLLQEPEVSLIHTHALNRLGGIALTAARLRRVPLVATIHGGVLDLPVETRTNLLKPLEGGFEWGKIFGMAFRARKVLEQADAIITCNQKEAGLLQKKYPSQTILVQPHGIRAKLFQEDQRAQARQAFPQIDRRQLLLAVGRIDPVKNQAWLIQQMPAILEKHPRALLVLAGACTDEAYGKSLKKDLRHLGLENHVVLTGGLPPGDPRLVGLLQAAAMVLLPSLSETFGLVILEAWAAGAPVAASRTSGACELIKEGANGWLFDLNQPSTFFLALEEALSKPDLASKFAQAGRQLAITHYDTQILAERVGKLYERLIEEKSR